MHTLIDRGPLGISLPQHLSVPWEMAPPQGIQWWGRVLYSVWGSLVERVHTFHRPVRFPLLEIQSWIRVSQKWKKQLEPIYSVMTSWRDCLLVPAATISSAFLVPNSLRIGYIAFPSILCDISSFQYTLFCMLSLKSSLSDSVTSMLFIWILYLQVSSYLWPNLFMPHWPGGSGGWSVDQYSKRLWVQFRVRAHS